MAGYKQQSLFNAKVDKKLYKPFIADSEKNLVKRLIRVLKRTYPGQWVTANRLYAHGFNRRELRLARKKSKGRIIQGQYGYKASEHAIREELIACANDFESRGREHFKSAQEYWNFIHCREQYDDDYDGIQTEL